eukprot:328786-Prymnesium_polylepis.1
MSTCAARNNAQHERREREQAAFQAVPTAAAAVRVAVRSRVADAHRIRPATPNLVLGSSASRRAP